MKKVMKLLAVVLCLVLVIGAIPVQAASSTDLSLKKTKKVLYLDGCKGTKANGKKAKYYSFLKVANNIKNFDSKKMDIKLVSEDESVCTVSNSNAKITAAGRGTTKVTITVRNKQEKALLVKTMTITVKKNSDKNFEVSGVKDGDKVKVGDSITVKMPRDKDDDYRRLTCDSNDVKIKKSGSYGSKYKVTFKKAGEYTLVAETYQTTTYKGTIAQKKFKVTVEGKAEPTPTPTATPTPTPTNEPTPTATPTPEPAKLDVKQSTLNTIVISGIADAANIKASDIEIYYEVAGSKFIQSGIENVTVEDGNVVVKMFGNFTADTEYLVTYKSYEGTPASFKGASSNTMDIADMDIDNKTVLVNQEVDLGIRYYDKNGVDITDGVAGLVVPSGTMVSNNISDAYCYGTIVCFLNANKSAVIEIEINKGMNELGMPIPFKKQFTVTSYEPQANGIIYTVKAANGVYFKKDDAQNTQFTKDETDFVIEALFVYKDAKGNYTYKTFDEVGVNKIKVGNDLILFVGSQDAAGGYKLLPNQTGTTDIVFYKGDTSVGKATVTVLEAKKIAGISVVSSKQNLNVNAIASDSLVLTATVKDQYGNVLKGQPLTIEQTEASKAAGTVTFGTFDSEGKLTVDGTSIVLNSGVKNAYISALVKCDSCTTTVSFQVADLSEANTWTLVSNPDQPVIQMDASIKPGDVLPQQVILSIQGKSGAYTVSKEYIQPYFGKQPTAQLKASDLGVTPGTTVYLFTVQKNGQYLSSLPAAVITNTSTEIQFLAYSAGIQLDAGNYAVTAYSVKAGDSNSQIVPLGQKTIVVTANKPVVIAKQVKATTTCISKVEIVKDCFEFYVNGTKLDASAVVDAEVNIVPDKKKALSAKVMITNSFYGSYPVDVDLTSSSVIS